jgi:outer membrane lipoprotein-sorting protein
MKRLSPLLVVGVACSFLGFASAPLKPTNSADLNTVLKKMDEVAASFRSTQADFQWETYQRAIDEIDDVQTGTIYYRRTGKEIEMMAEVRKDGPSADEMKEEPKYLLFKNGKIQMFLPKLNQVTEKDVGKNRQEFESYLVLGFGGSGEDLQKEFDVTYVGPEKIDGIATAHLSLAPKSQSFRNTFQQIDLWIDLDKGVSKQQKFINPQGDYRLAKYSDIQVNGKKIPDEVFKLRTNNKTQFVSPAG